MQRLVLRPDTVIPGDSEIRHERRPPMPSGWRSGMLLRAAFGVAGGVEMKSWLTTLAASVLFSAAVAAAGGCGSAGDPAVASAPPLGTEAEGGGRRACNGDGDCFHTGCSGQICANEDVITTCVFTCEYGCLSRASCGC